MGFIVDHWGEPFCHKTYSILFRPGTNVEFRSYNSAAVVREAPVVVAKIRIHTFVFERLMDRAAYWDELYKVIGEYNLLQHPFYQAWNEGELTLQDLRDYAAEYYHHVASFPGYLRRCAATLPIGELRQSILRNLWEEIGMEGTERRPHSVLWLEFALACGATAWEVFNRTSIPEVTELVDTFNQLARSGRPCQALAAFYVYESQVPRIARQKAKTLMGVYGFDAAACSYFSLHSTADVAHSQVWREQLDQVLKRDPLAIHESILAAKVAARALWKALDGINKRRLSRLSSGAN
jgi:pyrroloquinoline-quinone synthase